MEGGDLIPEKIHTRIERTQIFLFVLSPASLKSEWCQLLAEGCNFLRPYLDNNLEASQKLKSCQAVLTK